LDKFTASWSIHIKLNMIAERCINQLLETVHPDGSRDIAICEEVAR